MDSDWRRDEGCSGRKGEKSKVPTCVKCVNLGGSDCLPSLRLVNCFFFQHRVGHASPTDSDPQKNDALRYGTGLDSSVEALEAISKEFGASCFRPQVARSD